MAQAEKALHADHRERMRQRVQENGLESLHEHEALEYLLYFAIPRRDTNALAHRLIQKFGGFCQVLEAPEEALAQVDGIGAASARLLHSILEFSRYYALHKRNARRAKPLRGYKAAGEYVAPLFIGQQEEQFYLVAMDDNYIPIDTLLVANGLPNKVSFDPQAMARALVATRCTHVLLAHNHPNGLAVPSREDLEATVYLVSLLGPLGIEVADHLIVTPTDMASLQKIGRMPYYEPSTRRISYQNRPFYDKEEEDHV